MVSKTIKSLTILVISSFFLIASLSSCGSKKEEQSEDTAVEEVVEPNEEVPAEVMEEMPAAEDSTIIETTAEDSTQSE